MIQFNMKKNFILLFSTLFIFAMIKGCGPAEEVVEEELEPETEEIEEPEEAEIEEEVDPFEQPEWYSETRPYKSEEGILKAAGSAISSDSTRAARQAAEISESRLVNGTVRIIEHIQEKAAETSGREVDTDAIIEMRYQLEVDDLASIAGKREQEVSYVEQREHYQAFTTHYIGKDELTSFLSDRFREKESIAWIATDYDINEWIAEMLGDEIVPDDEVDAEED